MNGWVLFDLDGTLTRSEEGIWNGVRYTAEKMGRPVPDAETLRRFIGPPLEWSFREYMGMTPEEARQAQTIYRERYQAVGYLENRVYPGVRAALRRLRKSGARLGVVTGKPIGPTRMILDHFGLSPLLETVVSATDGHAEKEFLIREALPENPGEVWMVGDRRFDMEGAVKAGVHALGVTYGYGDEEELRSAGAERLASSPREIPGILCPETPWERGAFLSMEGMDGSGKGTQIQVLRETLERYGWEVVSCREPGGTAIGEKIRQILLDRENSAMTDITEALLYAAARAQLVREVIRPAVADGRVVLCDRFVDSSAAYQGGGRQLGVELVRKINEPALDGTMPDWTVWLDIDHERAMRRRRAVSEPDRIELADNGFHTRTEQAYRELAAAEANRFLTVNADQDREAVSAEMMNQVLARLMEAER